MRFRLTKKYVHGANPGDVVGDFVCIRATSSQPSDDSPDWQRAVIEDRSLIVPGPKGDKGDSVKGDKGDPGDSIKGDPGLNFKGRWRIRNIYKQGEVVTHEGSSFVCSAAECSREPSADSRQWSVLAERGERGDPGERGGAGQRGRSSIALQNEILQRVEELEVQSISGVESVSTLFIDAASKGMAVAINTDGEARLAVASRDNDEPDIDIRAVAGLVLADVGSGQTGTYATDGIISRDDWTDVTGTVFLSPGYAYLLSETEPGKLVPYDTSVEHLFLAVVGKAVSKTSLEIEIATPIRSAVRLAEFDSECLAGAMVYISSPGDPFPHADKAKADDLATATAVGLTFGNFAAGTVGKYLIAGNVYDPNHDWTASTGSPELVPGPYWLSTTDAGMMTPVEPSTPGTYKVRLGQATDENIFEIRIEPPELIA